MVFVPVQIGMINPSMNLKTDFITKYGSFASGFDSIDVMGGQTFNTTWPYLASAGAFVFMLFLFYLGSEEIDPNTNKPIPKTRMQIIYTRLGVIFFLGTLFGCGYGIYLYFAVFSPQHAMWYSKLPYDAKLELKSIHTIDNLTAQVNNNNNNNNRKRFRNNRI